MKKYKLNYAQLDWESEYYNNGLAFLAFQSYVDGKANIGLWNFIKNNGFKRSHMQDPKWRINFEPAGYEISFKEFLEGPLVDGEHDEEEDWKMVADQLKEVCLVATSGLKEYLYKAKETLP